MVAFLHRVMPGALSLVITEDKEYLKRHSGELMGSSVKSVLNVLRPNEVGRKVSHESADNRDDVGRASIRQWM